jgi:nitrate reductase NapE component
MTARQSASKKIKTSVKRARTKQSRRKTSPRVKKIIVFILVSLLSVGFLGGYALLNKLNKQFASAESSTSLDDSYGTVLFVVLDDLSKETPTIKKLEYSIFDYENKKIYTYSVKPSFEVTLGGKFGTEPVASFMALGALNNEDRIQGGISFVNKALLSLFAFPTDKYVYVSEQEAWSWEGLLKEGSFWPLLLDGRGANTYTNIPLDEAYKLSKFISSLPEDRRVTTDVSASTLSSLDETVREITIGSKMAQEAKSIAVLNATSYEGVASFGARVVNNLGGRVVSIDNSDNKFAEDFIVSDSPEDYSVQLLSKAFGINKIISKDVAKQYVTDNQLYRADILLILGK